MSATAYPLSWPAGWPRTADAFRVDGRYHFRRPGSSPFWTFAAARDALIRELRLLGASDIVLSSNFRTDRNGVMVEQNKRPNDQGLAVYFTLLSKPNVMARDCYERIEENMRSLTLTIEAMRTIDRHGGAYMMSRAFDGFAALPAPGQHARRTWWQVLDIPRTAGRTDVEAAYKRKAREAHPDLGGNDTAMAEINEARDAALQEITR